jgi:hypothetical protein
MFHIDASNQHPRDIYEFVTSVCQQKSVHIKNGKSNSRHLIVINIVDNLKKNVALGIKAMMNKYIANAIFVIRNDGGFHIDEHLINSCQQVRLCIDHDLFAADFILKVNNHDDVNMNQLVLSDLTDPMNMCIALECGNYKHIDPLMNFVFHHMDTMFESLINPTSTLETYGKHVRNFCIKVGAACLSIAIVCRHVMAWTMTSTTTCTMNNKGHGQDQGQGQGQDELFRKVLHMLAEMEHATKCVSKPLFTLEHNIDGILQLIVKSAK